MDCRKIHGFQQQAGHPISFRMPTHSVKSRMPYPLSVLIEAKEFWLPGPYELRTLRFEFSIHPIPKGKGPL